MIRVHLSLSEVYSVRVLKAASLLFSAAESDHDALQARLNDAQQGPLKRVAVPARLHELPALLVETGQPLWSGTCTTQRHVRTRRIVCVYSRLVCVMWTFFNVGPQLIFAGALLKGFWEFDWTSAEIPEKNPKGVDVNRVIILSCHNIVTKHKLVILHRIKINVYTWIDFKAPVNSSGAMWMGVPTMLPDIMASGLQKPRSVIFARFCLSNWKRNERHQHQMLRYSFWTVITDFTNISSLLLSCFTSSISHGTCLLLVK